MSAVNFPLLDLLPDAERQHLKLRMVRYGAGEVIYERGGDCMDVFFIFEGLVKVDISAVCGNTAFFHYRRPGDCIGWYAAFTGKTQPKTAWCAETSYVGRMGGADFVEMVLSRRELSAYMLKRVTLLLRQETNRIRNLILFDAAARVAADLLECLEETGGSVVCVEDRTEFATRIGMTRETLARHLSQMQRDGLIAIQKNEIHVLDAKHLAELTA